LSTPTSSRPPSDIPGIPDPLGLIAAAVPLGVLVGTLVATATVLAVTIIRASTVPVPGASVGSTPQASVLLGGTFTAVVAAAAATWFALSPVSNVYRRAMFGTVSGFATVVVMLITAPVNQLLGQAGLAGLAAVCVAGILVLTRRLRAIRAAAR
jgi:hypothetical protein